jgi:hypothetical protein
LFDFNVLIDSRHWKISTGLHFQNGRHNTAKVQHCSISKVAFNLFFKPVGISIKHFWHKNDTEWYTTILK